MPKTMGYYRLWVVTEMGYDRVNCTMSMMPPLSTLGLHVHELFSSWFSISHQIIASVRSSDII